MKVVKTQVLQVSRCIKPLKRLKIVSLPLNKSSKSPLDERLLEDFWAISLSKARSQEIQESVIQERLALIDEIALIN